MKKWKHFVKGRGLHEESCSFSCSTPKSASDFPIKGEEAKLIYDEIITLPSTAVVDSQIVDEYDSQPSSIASSRLRTESVASSNPKPKLGQLMKFCETNNNKDLRTAFENYHIDIDEKDEFGWTLLMSAACAGASSCVNLIFEYGANWRLLDKTGRTALTLAQKNNRKETSQLIYNWQEKIKLEEQRESEESESEIEDSESIQVEFCETCKINFTNKKQHYKSIAHLVSISQNYKEKTHYGIPESNIGYQLMLRTGWKEGGLGPEGLGQKFPVKTVLKRNRRGLGNEQEKNKARITHFAPFDPAAVERSIKPEERLERKRTLQKKQDLKLKSKERNKEIRYRRELGSL